MQNALNELMTLMKERNIDVYIVFTNDDHNSEYLDDYYKEREYLTGFTGSTGDLIVFRDKAYLWTDGRYFVQAKEQLEPLGQQIELMKMGVEGTPTMMEFLQKHLNTGMMVASFGAWMSYDFSVQLERLCLEKGVSFQGGVDLPALIWQQRPKRSHKLVEVLPGSMVGMKAFHKMELLRQHIQSQHAYGTVLTALDQIAWMTNLRGFDMPYSRLFFAFFYIDMEKAILYLQPGCWNEVIRKTLAAEGIMIATYDSFYHDVVEHAKRAPGEILLDRSTVNAYLAQTLLQTKKARIVELPVELAKSKKTPNEIKHLANAHIKDGVALTKFMYWLKNQENLSIYTEISLGQKLEEFRKEQKGYLCPSFDPIVAFQEHGAIVHYSATEQTDRAIQGDGLLLMDTGAQYVDGTTDVTRTFAIGAVTDMMKTHYTAVLRGHLHLLHGVFAKGCRGENLDILARRPLWELGLDYLHGTGHGVGYLLNVHEGPNAIRFHLRDQGKFLTCPFQPGMVTSNEPGLYIEGEYGIRLENMMYCIQLKYKDFYGFEPLTMTPFDMELVDLSQMTVEEKVWLKDYHQMVYDQIHQELTSQEQEWLKEMI